MKTNKIRKLFLDFFESKSHKIVLSDSLVSHDPTLLFTSAGMNQFKDKFLGKDLTYTRACSCQKCFRTGDLDNVGRTPRHHTFFEMLGNFSFGDYFKEDAISFAWEFFTQVLKINSDLLWVSVYKDDGEAYNIWYQDIGIPAEKIVKLGAKENFWPSNVQQKGPDGPCGPCSEIFYDQGKEIGCGKPDCKPGCDCDRFLEIWNLVFTQYEREKGGKLKPLPQKNIDTGMGLERLAAVMQGVENNFEIDIFKPIVEKVKTMSPACRQARCEPGANDSSVYAIADHVRAIVFAIGDGISPSSDSRGYVIRKLINKSIRHGRGIGISNDFLTDLVPVVINVMKFAYPELEKKESDIIKIIKAEEKKNREINVVVTPNNLTIKPSINRPEVNISVNDKVISGEEVFKLHDTYGIHIHDIEKIVAENNLKIDKKGFENCMQKQKKRSREKSNIKNSIFASEKHKLDHLPETKFTGYKEYKSKAKIISIIKNGKFAEKVEKGEEILVILNKTPFYGESGGQVGDIGQFKAENLVVEISDTFKENGYILHKAKVKKGVLNIKDEITACIDAEHRQKIKCNHTATHLLHWGLRKVLGTHVKQSGSLVSCEKLRFDFSHFKSVTTKELNEVELLINKKIMENMELVSNILDKNEAKKKGFLAFFKDKYKDKVRVINISGFSKELCAGTHVKRTGEIGLFKITNETSVASGIRRIEAITGQEAYCYCKDNEKLINKLCGILKSEKNDIVDLVKEQQQMIKSLNDKIAGLNVKMWNLKINQLIDNAREFNDIKIITYLLDSIEVEEFGRFSDLITKKHDSCITLIGNVCEDKFLFVVGMSANLISKGFHAGDLIKKISELFDGGGGGNASFAQAGGKDITEFDRKMKSSVEIIVNYIKGCRK